MKLGEKICYLRKMKGLTQAELGDIVFVTDKAVSKWESGKSEPDISTLRKLADIFDIDVKRLIAEDDTLADFSGNNSKNHIEYQNKTLVKKFPFTPFIVGSALLATFLTLAVIIVLIILNIIGNVTDRVTGLLDNWYQVVLFGGAILFLGLTAVFIYLAISQKKRLSTLKVVSEGKKLKWKSPTLWGALSFTFVVLFAGSMIGGDQALNNRSSINAALGVEEFIKVGGGKNYYQSDYLKENGKIDSAAVNAAGKEIVKEVSNEGTVLLWNNNNTLPLAKQSKVSIFGMGSQKYLLSGFGNHDTYANQTEDLKTVLESGVSNFSVNPTLWNKYSSLLSTGNYGEKNSQGSATKNNMFNGKNGYLDGRYREYEVREASWSTLTSNVTESVQQYNDAAIMVITRDGSEDGDTWFPTNECFDNTYLDLSTEEADVLSNLKLLKDQGKLKKIIVVLNTKMVMQMANLTKEQYGVDACLFPGVNGVSAYKSLSEILCGEVSPSGHLADVMAYDTDSAPATVNTGYFKWTQSNGLPATDLGVYNDFYLSYSEGIYVGYRYFETRYEDFVLNNGRKANSTAGVKNSQNGWKYQEEVAFPFGFGESYSNFEYSNYKVTHVDGDFGGTYKVSIDVKNTGTMAAKTAVQVYLQKPYTDYDVTNNIEKAAVELIGFTKTDLLEPNETKNYVVNVKGSEFKSYDAYNKGTYILEKGDYYLSVGNDSHDALNNILASKGKSSADGMVNSRGISCDGNSNLTKKITIADDDFTTYSVSEHTGYKIENRLSSTCDLNVYEGTKSDQRINYLSRKNWEGTYPVPASLKCVNSRMVYDMQYDHDAPDATGYEMPTMGKTTVDPSFFDQFVDLKKKALSLIMLRELDYDDPLWDDLLNQLTWSDINMLTSGGYLNLHGLSSINAPSGSSKDGTYSIILNGVALGIGYPASNVLSQTFNTELVEKMGKIFGNECLDKGVAQLYGPSADMHRTPYGGRNGEYYSEDPFMSGAMLAAECSGIESKGIMVCAKHFAFNDQEINRCGVATFLNEQSAREIYLKGWEMAFNSAKVSSIMASFARLGTRYVGSCEGLMNHILRKEWKFKGFVETDSAFDQEYMTTPAARAEAICSGVDFWMDGSSSMHLGGYSNNARVVCAARESAHRMLYSYVNSAIMNGVSSYTTIVQIVPFWVNLLTGLRIGSGIIMGLLLVMFGFTLALYIIKRKEYVWDYQGINAEYKVKERIDRIVGPSISGVILAGVSAFLVITLLSSSIVRQNFKEDKEGAKDVLNQYASDYEMDVTNGLWYLDADTKGVNETEKCIGIQGAGYENEYAVSFDSSASTTATLSIEISGSAGVRSIMDTFRPYVNGKPYYTTALTEPGTLWFSYYVIEIGDIDIVRGTNTISFLYTESNSGASLNMRSLTLNTRANITPKLASKPIYVLMDEYEFSALDYRVVTNGGKNKNENCVGAYYNGPTDCTLELEFVINSPKAVDVDMFYNVSTLGNSVAKVTDIYESWMNNSVIEGFSNMPTGGALWMSYSYVFVSHVHLNAGNNILNIEYDWNSTNNLGTGTTNFRSLKFLSDETLTLVEPTHECHHVCPICGGCTDETCEFSVCQSSKCTCEKTTKTINASDCASTYGHISVDQSSGIAKLDSSYLYGYIVFEFNAEKAGSANFSMTMSRNPTDSWIIADYYRIWVNSGTLSEWQNDNKANILSKGKYTASTIVGQSTVFDTIKVGTIDIKEGANKIVIGWTAVGNASYAFSLKDIRLETANNTITVD